jgi:hypothetical protein
MREHSPNAQALASADQAQGPEFGPDFGPTRGTDDREVGEREVIGPIASSAAIRLAVLGWVENSAS